MTTLGPSTDYTGASVTQGGKKTFIAAMRALIADRLGVGYNLAPENVASASNVDLSGINTRQINLTGTTQVDTVTAPVGLNLVAKATGAITLKAAVTGTGADILVAAGDSWTWRATAADTMEIIGLTLAEDVGASFVPVRQTVLSGPVDSNGLPSFGGSTGGTTVTVAGTLIVTAANGFTSRGQRNRTRPIVNPSWTGLSTNGTMYLYLDIDADGVCTPGAGTLAPTYRWGGADVVTADQFTFNVQEMVGKVGNGAAAVQTYRVYVGRVTVAGGVVTAITWYALQGRYDSGLFAVTTSTAYSKNHNLGTIPRSVQVFVADDTAGTNEVPMIGFVRISTNEFGAYPSAALSRTSMQYTTAAVGVSLNFTGGALASGAYRYIAGRGW